MLLPGSVAEIMAPKKKQSFTVNVIGKNLVKANIKPLKTKVDNLEIFMSRLGFTPVTFSAIT